MTTPTLWWHAPSALHRFVCDLLAGELARLRPGRAVPAQPWDAAARLDEDLAADSLERVHLATALAEAIHLYRSGIDDALLGRPTLGEWIATAARSLDAYSEELTFKTSGSTGHPKWFVHARAELDAEAAVHAGALAGARRVIAAVPSHHIYGFLFAILLPARLGIEVVDVRGDAPARLGSLLEPGDLVVGHPDFWAAVLRSVPRLPPGATGVSSTAPLPHGAARGIVARGLERLVEVYGSSETAGIGTRDDPAAPFTLLEHLRRGAGEGELLRTLPDGGERPIAVPDRLEWIDDRHVRPAGRTEGAVQVGGQNVVPAQVAAALREHPEVADAVVRLMRPDEGDRLKAFVVPRDAQADPGRLADELWRWIDTRLTAPERPKSLVFGPALPTGALGKAADWPVPAPPAPIAELPASR